MLDYRVMNTDFIVRDKNGDTQFFKPTDVNFSLVDGALLLGVLAAFMGLILLLAK
jgi:hypothetical protein